MNAGARIVIAGAPRTGKTTLAARLAAEHGLALRSTDILIGKFDWSDASAEAAKWMDEPGGFVWEGVAIPRALRKWLAAHPEGLPADRFVWLSVPREQQTKGQAACGKGCATVWTEILPELRRRGAQIFTDTEGGPL